MSSFKRQTASTRRRQNEIKLRARAQFNFHLLSCPSWRIIFLSSFNPDSWYVTEAMPRRRRRPLQSNRTTIWLSRNEGIGITADSWGSHSRRTSNRIEPQRVKKVVIYNRLFLFRCNRYYIIRKINHAHTEIVEERIRARREPSRSEPSLTRFLPRFSLGNGPSVGSPSVYRSQRSFGSDGWHQTSHRRSQMGSMKNPISILCRRSRS